jgi:hypothetical protein
MNAEVGRRMFIGSIAGGVPLLAGGGVALLAQSDRLKDDHAHEHGNGRDAVLDAGLQHLGKVTRAAKARQGPLTLEEAVSSAAYVRMIGARIRDLDLDAAAQRVLRERVATTGRDTLLYETIDRARVRQHLAPYGIEIDDRLIGIPDAADYAARAAALDRALTTPISSAFERAASVLDAAAVAGQKIGPGVQRVQYSPDETWLSGYCKQLQTEMFHQLVFAQAFCNALLSAAFLESLCVTLFGALAVMGLAYLWDCVAPQLFFFSY